MSGFDSTLWMRLVQEAAPLLPRAGEVSLLRQAGWAVVLAAVLSAGAQSRAVGPARAALRLLAWLVALWACWPGPWGLSYWLGLAFQTPSLMAMAWALRYLWLAWGPKPGPQLARGASLDRSAAPWALRYALLGVALGWLLLLDTFAYLPVSVYAWGFSPLAFALCVLIALVPWVVGARPAQAASVWAVLVVFGLTRWPTGNVWDALLDPWLWLALHWQVMAHYRVRPGV